MNIITIFLSWDHLPLLYTLSNLYAVLHATTRQRIPFSFSLYSQSWTITPLADSLISVAYSFLLTIVLIHSMIFYSYSVNLSTSFFNILSLTQQISSRVYKTIHMYLFLTLDLHNICVVLQFFSLVQLFFLSLPFMLPPQFWNSSLTHIIIIFSFQDRLHLLYMLFKPLHHYSQSWTITVKSGSTLEL